MLSSISKTISHENFKKKISSYITAMLSFLDFAHEVIVRVLLWPASSDSKL